MKSRIRQSFRHSSLILFTVIAFGQIPSVAFALTPYSVLSLKHCASVESVVGKDTTWHQVYSKGDFTIYKQEKMDMDAEASRTVVFVKGKLLNITTTYRIRGGQSGERQARTALSPIFEKYGNPREDPGASRLSWFIGPSDAPTKMIGASSNLLDGTVVQLSFIGEEHSDLNRRYYEALGSGELTLPSVEQ